MKSKVLQLDQALKGREEIVELSVADPHSMIVKVQGACVDGFALAALTAGKMPEGVVPGTGVIATVEELPQQAAEDFKVAVGDTVYIEPPMPCNRCVPCLTGHYSACVCKQRYGIDRKEGLQTGGCAEYMNVPRGSRVHRLAAGTTLKTAALYVQAQRALAALDGKGLCGLGKQVAVLAKDLFGVLCAVAARDMGASSVSVQFKNRPADALVELLTEKRIDVVDSLPEKEYSILVDACGSAALFDRAIRCLEPLGRCVLAAGDADYPLPAKLIMAKELELTGLDEASWTFEQAEKLLRDNPKLVAFITVKAFPLADFSDVLRTIAEEPFMQSIILPNISKGVTL